MKYLISGGAGFIGSHLCEAVLGRGDSAACLDNFLTGRRDNVAHLEGNDRFRLLQRDVCDPITPSEAGDPDFVLHFASPASPIGYRQHSLETLLANSVGTINLLRLATECGATFLMASTSEVYGDPEIHPQTEDYWGNVNPNGLRACYDESKRFSEAAAMEWMRVHGTDVRIIRIFNTYGPRNQLDDGRVVPNFITQAVRGEPLTIYGDGQQTRSFQFVSDLVAGVLRLLDTPGLAGQVFNLGNPVEFTILEFASLVQELTGSRSELVFRPLLFKDDPARRRPDITRARDRLGWEPRVSLRQGLELTIPWYREQLAG